MHSDAVFELLQLRRRDEDTNYCTTEARASRDVRQGPLLTSVCLLLKCPPHPAGTHASHHGLSKAQMHRHRLSRFKYKSELIPLLLL